MKFSLDYTVDVDGTPVPSAELLAQVDKYRTELSAASAWEGSVLVCIDGQAQDLDLSEPLVRLLGALLRKMPWVIGGDTETVALRNSEQCFAFTPAGEGSEFSFFHGTELEVEEYVLEPITVLLKLLIPELLGMGERMVSLLGLVEPTALEGDEDCRDLASSLSEAKAAWKEHQRNRR